MLDARRKNKATNKPEEASETTTTKKKAKTPTPEGAMRTIALARAYLEHEAQVDDNGVPIPRHYFDPAGRAAKALPKDTRKDRVVNWSDFLAHINETVARPIFGVPLRGLILRRFLEGVSDQVLQKVEQGYKIKYANLAQFEKALRAPRKARNPRSGEEVAVPSRITLSVKAARSAKEYLAQAQS